MASSRALSSRGEVKMSDGSRVPSLNIAPPSQRSAVSSVMSGGTVSSARMDELSKVKQELEEALNQVKQEMRGAGATKSQYGSSTSRSQSVMSDISGLSRVSSRMSCSTMGTDWEIAQELANVQKVDPKLATHRGRAKFDVKKKSDKPLVQRPTKNKQGKYLPAPDRSQFRHETHITTNQTEYKPLGPASKRTNQGPHKIAPNRKESDRPFSKLCEKEVRSSAITGSKVFAPRVATR